MAKTQTQKSRYPSKYSPGKFVTAAQYIVELLCEQKVKKEGKELPVRFWKLPEWQSYYVSQTRATNKLLDKYEAECIIRAVKERRLFSLRPKWVEEIIKTYKPKPKPKPTKVEVGKQVNKTNQRNKLDKLRFLDE